MKSKPGQTDTITLDSFAEPDRPPTAFTALQARDSQLVNPTLPHCASCGVGSTGCDAGWTAPLFELHLPEVGLQSRELRVLEFLRVDHEGLA